MKILILSSLTVVSLFSHSVALGDQYLCEPTEVDIVRRVFIDSNEDQNVVTIEFMDSSKTSGVAEYGDDVDMEFYFSEKLNVQVEWYWNEMNEVSKAEGNLIRSFENQPSVSIPVECSLVK